MSRPPPLPADALVALARAIPPHRAFEAFLDHVRRFRLHVDARSPEERLAAKIARHGEEATLVALDGGDLAELGPATVAGCVQIREALTARWPETDPRIAPILERVDAARELTVLIEANRVPAPAGARLRWLAVLARPADPPADLAAFFRDPAGAEIGLRACRPLLMAEAPTLWRRIATDYARLLDVLDPVRP